MCECANVQMLCDVQMCKCFVMCKCANVQMCEWSPLFAMSKSVCYTLNHLHIFPFAHLHICTFTLLFFQQSYGHLLVRFGLRGRIVVGRVVRYGELDRIIHLLVQ